MSHWRYFMNIINKIFAHNWFAVVYFNFKMLPFQQAIKLPFDFYRKIRFENLSGMVTLKAGVIRRGMIKFGGRGSEMYGRGTTVIDLRGNAVFHGVTEIGHGSLLRIEEGATTSFGNEVRFGAFTKIFCAQTITFADEIDFSWECQIFDTNFHYVRNIKSGLIENLTGPVHIGSFNWFGNRVTIMKGTKTPDHFVCASNSLCNKNYLNFPQYSVVGGYPAKLVAMGKQRVFENLEDVAELDLPRFSGAAT